MTTSPTTNPQDDLDEVADDAIIAKAFRWSLMVIGAVGIAGALGIYWYLRPKPAESTKSTPLVVPERRKQDPAVIPTTKFTDITKAAGIAFVHVNGAYGEKLLPETMGGGVAFFDFDNDDDQDLLLINSCYWPWKKPAGQPEPTMALYRNDGGKFTDVTKGSGLDITCYGMGVACGDYDGDGKVDVYITAVGPNFLFRNLGGGKFQDVTATAGVAGAANEWSTSAAFLDIDNDGRLDLFVCNYLKWSKEYDLAQNFTLDGKTRAYGRPQAFEGTFSYLFRNEGGGRFRDVPESAGVQIRNQTVPSKPPAGKSLGVAPVDLDHDGWIDFIVANDTVQNFVFHNQRNGTFREIGIESGVAFDRSATARGAMGIDTGRFRNDNSLGIVIGNFANEMTALYVSQTQPLNFIDEAESNGLGPQSRLVLKFGVFFFDYDLDGRMDIFAANGHLEDDIKKIQASQEFEQPAHLYWNCGPQHRTEFALVPEDKTGGDLVEPTVGRGATYADIDGDGDLDVVVTAIARRPKLLRNDQALGNRWLRVQLVGSGPNRDAIGAWVEATVGGTVQYRQVMPTKSYLSQAELPVTFGVGKYESVERLRIRWPNGTVQTLENVATNQRLKIEQPPRAPAGASGRGG